MTLDCLKGRKDMTRGRGRREKGERCDEGVIRGGRREKEEREEGRGNKRKGEKGDGRKM